MKNRKQSAGPCFCGNPRPYAACCEPLHQGRAPAAATPEPLMRSRYSAFVLGLSDYLASSWAPETRPAGPLATEPDRKWLGLKVIAVAVADNGQTGSVEFIARSRVAGKGVRLHEKSRFRLSGNGWLYIDGETDA